MKGDGEKENAAQGRDVPRLHRAEEMPRPPGGAELTCYDPDFETGMDASRDFMRRYPNALRKLAGG